MSSKSPSLAAGAVWSSAFRPFFLLGSADGLLLMCHWLGVTAELWPGLTNDLPRQLWHGHEMVFGFAAAVVVGFVLTALPSWANTTEIVGARLRWLVGLWLAGRVAMILPMPPLIAALLDGALFPVMAGMLAPQLARASNRYYLLLLPILVALCAANLIFHGGMAAADAGAMSAGLRLAIHALILLFVLTAGVLTPIFTGNALREKGRDDAIPLLPWLDALAAMTVVALAGADLARLPAMTMGSLALLACAVHAVRLVRWRGWRVVDAPLVLVMHLGYAWLTVAFGLKAAAALAGGVTESAWVHAFTVGALGMMMMGLMTRVTLRHTGRSLRVPATLLLAYASMFVAAVLRVGAALGAPEPQWLKGSALLWAIAILLFFARSGAMLWRESLPARPSIR
ncbi:MAG: NnrS family protein [Rhodocyclaceae bacterium]|nr:NnrS family protein [Rhodocyclaceae bacterium]